jgi:hypothetical protein
MFRADYQKTAYYPTDGHVNTALLSGHLKQIVASNHLQQLPILLYILVCYDGYVYAIDAKEWIFSMDKTLIGTSIYSSPICLRGLVVYRLG